jgi:hypothetical protein
MPASKNKTILFGNATHNKARHLWPVAVFNDDAAAKSYATFLRLAYRADDDAAIKILDPAAHRDDEGKALTDTKWSVVTVPYAPQPAFEEDDATEPAA